MPTKQTEPSSSLASSSSLTEVIDAEITAGDLDQLTINDLATLRQKLSETKVALANFYHTAPPDLAAALTRAQAAL